MALTPAGFDPVKPQALHPRIAELWFIRCQTSLNSLIYGANFRNYVPVTEEEFSTASASVPRRLQQQSDLL